MLCVLSIATAFGDVTIQLTWTKGQTYSINPVNDSGGISNSETYTQRKSKDDSTVGCTISDESAFIVTPIKTEYFSNFYYYYSLLSNKS